MASDGAPARLTTDSPFWRTATPALRSWLIAGGIGASIALYAQQIIKAGWVNAFIQSNQLEPQRRKVLLLTIVVGAALGLIAPLPYLLWKRSALAVDRMRRLLLFLSPLLLIGLLPGLFRWKPWQSNEGTVKLTWLLVLFVVALEGTMRLSLENAPERLRRAWTRGSSWISTRLPGTSRAVPLMIVIAAAVFYGAIVGTMQLRLHHRMGTASFDLGYYDNLFYNSLHGHPMRCAAGMIPPTDWSAMRGHAELTTFLFLPIYALAPRAETLLWLQAFVIGSGAIPIYLLAARHLPRATAMALGCCYTLMPALQSANLYDFHMQPIAGVLVLWTLYFIDSRNNLAFALFFMLALGCREDIGIGLAVVGTVMLLAGYRPVLGIVIAALSAAYFLGMKFYIMPKFGGWWFQEIYKDLFPQGDRSFGGVIKSMITNPLFVLGTLLTKEKLEYVLKLMLPFAFLPFRRSWVWVLLVPGMISTILTTGYGPTVQTSFQYVAHWITYGFLGTLIGLVLLRREQGNARFGAAVVAIVVATLVVSYNWGLMFQRNNFVAGFGPANLAPLEQKDWDRLARFRALVAMIPRDAVTAASEWEHPQFSNRLTAYTLRIGLGEPPPDYILYNTGSGVHGANQAREALNSGKYAVQATSGEFQLLKRK